MKFVFESKSKESNNPSIKEQKVWTKDFFVHNVLDTSGESVDGYGSTLKYWEKVTGKKASGCCAIDPHTNSDGTDSDLNEIVGAHVRIDNESCPSDEAWIVPLCKHCNNANRTWSIPLKEGTMLVPVKMSKSHETASHPMDDWVKGCWRLFWR